jgi:tetratricopeptide (TPR) repeat protein
MQENFELLWRRARALENDGKIAAARDIYQRLIEEDPERLYVRIRLSAIERSVGNYRDALEHAVRCAESVRGSRWKDMADVTRLLLAFDERLLVRDLIMGTDWSHPDIVRNSAVLSQHLWLIGEVADALRLMDVAMAHGRPGAALTYSRANALRYLGRSAEATAEYERCLQIAPEDAHAHWSLAYHEKASLPGARIPRIEAALTAHEANSPSRPFLHYALYKEHEDAGNLEQAWDHLMAGARSRRKEVRYNPTREAEGFAALEAMTPPGFLDDRPAFPASGAVPIFVLGMPRSGTTLLERILGGHSEVAAAGELSDFNSALSWESNQFLPPFAHPQALEKLRDVDFAKVGERYAERTRAWAHGKRFMVDKNPANFINAGFIAKALPRARILCLRRGAMDACLSNLKVLFTNDAFGYSYDLDELADYYLRFDRLSRHWTRVLGGQYLEVDYEQLVAEPLAMTERVMAFCGLAFEPGSVDITRNQAPVTTASSSQVRQPINTRGIGAWRKYARQLEPLRARLERVLEPARP